MKKITIIGFILILLEGCYFSRPCPIKNCHVAMEHKHEGHTFSPHGLFHVRFHYVGEKAFKGDKNKKEIAKKRKAIERG